MAINTKHVDQRRKLHFDSYEQLLAEAERLAAAERVRNLGNWSLGQVLKHLAIVMHNSIDGFRNRPPLPIRLLLRMMKNRFVRRPHPSGIQLPKSTSAEIIPGPETTTQDGLISLRDAIRRLRTDSRRVNHPAFGKLTREEWDQMNFRHAELHLSFIEITE
ncbi:MAG: DUF1569 domain-containing protein [Planctomycetes bacterium]|nr:DUF1569 domain-containing protein [Planctomycetota bacterium]